MEDRPKRRDWPILAAPSKQAAAFVFRPAERQSETLGLRDRFAPRHGCEIPQAGGDGNGRLLPAADTRQNVSASVGVGKTHLAIALAYTACLHGKTTLFTSAVEIVNALAAAQATGGIKREMARLLKPSLLVIDELGYLPIDKFGADGLFQVISQRYERGSTVITTNRAFKQWPEIFNNDSTLTSALLDRLLHHAESVVIEGRSDRMRDQTDA